VISRRVIEERKSLKELHSTVAREPRPSGVHVILHQYANLD
jgi:protein SPT2